MTKNQVKYLVLSIMIIIIIIIIIKFLNYYEHFTNSLKWTSRKLCFFSGTLSDILKENEIYYNHIESDWDVYIPCHYESINEEYNSIRHTENGKYFLIDDSDLMVAKEELWKTVVKKYGKKQAIKMMPKSYLLDSQENINKFKDDFDSNKIYIMKRNIQRQEGLNIINSLPDILKIVENDKNSEYKYIIIQELLQNPYLISDRKINLRIYVLVVCKGDSMEVYMYNDGFMYYTAEKFIHNSLESGPNITTGYIDRKVYEENPLTHQDFKKYLDDLKRPLTRKEKDILYNNGSLANYTFNNIQTLIKNVFAAYKNSIGKNKKLYNNVKFQLFGVDVAISDTLDAQIMEINKGPDLGAKDKRDSDLKHNLVRNIFYIVNLNLDKNFKNNFIKLT